MATTKPIKQLLYQREVEDIGKRIKYLRMNAGYKSSETFAFAHDLPRVQYWRMEKGTNFTIKGFLKILDIYKMPLEEFFSSDSKFRAAAAARVQKMIA